LGVLGTANERRAELEWLAKESGPYAGQWVALHGNDLVAHGPKLAVVSAAARAAGVEEPFFASVPDDKDLLSAAGRMYRLEFASLHWYASEQVGISVPVVLTSGANTVRLVASVDTFCLFRNELAEALGLDPATCSRRRFRTANSSFEAFGHEVEISVLRVTTYATVYFFMDASINKNVLRRVGWLDQVRLGLVDHDSRLYLSPYD